MAPTHTVACRHNLPVSEYKKKGLWLRLPERQFPAGSEVGRWARERLRCGEWDVWARNLHACLPRAPPGLLERRLSQFLDWGGGGGG